MQLSLAVKWLAAVLLALLALALPIKGAGADGLLQRGVFAPSPRSHAGRLASHARLHGRSDSLRIESDIRHRLRLQALRRGHGAREVVALGSGPASALRGQRTVVIGQHPFPDLEKGGLFAPAPAQTLVFVQPHQIRGPLSGPFAAARPRKVLAHGGHGLYDHRSELFGGQLGGRRLAPGHDGRPPGLHPRVLVVEPIGR